MRHSAQSLLAIAAAAAMIGCAGSPPAVQAPAAERNASVDRQVMTVDEVASLEQVLTELPGSIPVDQAEGLLVQIDPQQVKDSAGYAVQATGTMATIGGGGERIVRGFLPNFQANYSSLYYLPYQNYYFPYYRSGASYLPMYGSSLGYGDGQMYPFFRRQWGFFYPYSYNNLSARSFFLGVWSGTLGLMERAGAWGGVHPGSPVLMPPMMPTEPMPTEPEPTEPAPMPTEPSPVPTEPTPEPTEPVDETTDETADETTDETADETTDETADETTDETVADETPDETTDATPETVVDDTETDEETAEAGDDA